MRFCSTLLLTATVAVTTSPAGAPGVPGPADASALFAAFAKMEGLEARFVEEKHLALLAAPLTSRGRLYFMRPGYLTRVVEEPESATLMISPSELRMSGKEGVETIDLRQNEDVRVFVTSLLHVFSGDKAALDESYEVAFTSAEEGWTLTLTPRRKPLTAMLRDLTLHGQGIGVGDIVVREPKGDSTVTRITEANNERKFTAEERASLFGIRR